MQHPSTILQSSSQPDGVGVRPTAAPSRLRRITHVALVAAILGVAVFGSIPLCPFAIVTRHPCPGCGLTRASLAMLHGDFAQALHFHPVSLVMAPIAIAGIAYNAVVYVIDGRKAAAESLQGKWVTRFAVVLAIAMVGVWIARFFGAFGGPVPV